MENIILEYITIRKNAREVFVSFNNVEKLNILVAEEVRKDLYEIIKTPHTHLVLNMNGIQFIDSEGFSVLNFISGTARLYDSEFSMVNVHGEIMELIQLVENHGNFMASGIAGEDRQGLSMAS